MYVISGTNKESGKKVFVAELTEKNIAFEKDELEAIIFDTVEEVNPILEECKEDKEFDWKIEESFLFV